MNAKEQKRFEEITRLAGELAGRLAGATADEDSPDYDRSRTSCDRGDDFEFAKRAARKLGPTLRAMERDAKGRQSQAAKQKSS